MIDIKYIGKFLNRDGVEGPRQTVGYIPCRPGNFYGRPNQDPARYSVIGVSGVTVATGVDLGQTDDEELRGYGVGEDLIRKLKPYLCRSSYHAIRVLANAPLSITEAEAEELDDCVHRGELERYIRPCYEKASGISFEDIPLQAQAVVFSICYQLGCSGVKRRAPKTWAFLTARNWLSASEELIHGFKGRNQYEGRRRIEGQLLAEVL